MIYMNWIETLKPIYYYSAVGPFVSEKVFLSSPSLLQTPKHVSQTRFNAKIDKVLTDDGMV